VGLAPFSTRNNQRVELSMDKNRTSSLCYTAIFLSIAGLVMLVSRVFPYAYWLVGAALISASICILKKSRKVR
jgi:hypothetical protein